MKATRVLAMGLALGLCGVACDSNKDGEDKSEKSDDDDGGKKKKKKKKKSDDDDGDKKKKGDGDDTPASDTPEPTAAPEPAPAEPAPAEPEPEPAPAVTCGGPKEIPDIPAEKSDAPSSLDEWKSGCAVNTVGANSEAPDCTVTVLREWLKVTCTGDMLGYENFEGFGVEGSDYFKSFTSGSLLSFVVRMRKGQSQKVRMCRTKERASLFVSWPPSKDKPTIIALQRGPKCDKSAWGSQ